MIAGHDPLDSTSMPIEVPDYVAALTGDIKGLKIGIPSEYFIEGIEPEVEAAVRAAIAQLESLGAELVEISLPHTEYSLPTYYIIAPAEASANLARYDGVRFGLRVEKGEMWPTYKATRGQGFGAEVKRRIMIGTYALSAGYYDAYYGKAQAVRTLIKQDFEHAFEQVDLIAAPTAPTTAFKIGANSRRSDADVFAGRVHPARLAGRAARHECALRLRQPESAHRPAVDRTRLPGGFTAACRACLRAGDRMASAPAGIYELTSCLNHIHSSPKRSGRRCRTTSKRIWRSITRRCA